MRFGVATQRFLFRKLCPQAPSFWDRNRDFQLKCWVEEILNSSTDFGSSSDTDPRMEFGFKGQNARICLWELLIKTSPKGSFSTKILHSITFWRHDRFIQTVTRLMRLGKRNRHKVKKCQNFNLGEQFSRKFPKLNFPAKNQNVLITFEHIKIEENCKRTTHRKLGSGNQTWRHLQSKTPPCARIYFSKITRKPSRIDEERQWTTYRKPWTGNQTVTSFPALDANWRPKIIVIADERWVSMKQF